MIICADGLTGICEAIETAFPQTKYQRCIAHQARSTQEICQREGQEGVRQQPTCIYTASNEELAMGEVDRVTEKWQMKYQTL